MFAQIVVFASLLLVLTSISLVWFGARIHRRHWLLSFFVVGLAASAAWVLHLSLLEENLPFSLTILVVLALAAPIIAVFDHWNPIGHAAFAAVVAAAASFLTYALFVITAAQLGPWSMAFAVVLFFLQFGTLALLVANMFEIIDVLCRVTWSRIATNKTEGFQPMVSLHVPIHSEPPELVIETLDALASLDYPNYEVLVIDNNTADEDLWRPVEEHCKKLGSKFRFFHLMPWPGYKSGARNFALTETAADAEVIGVIDADYVTEPNFLSDLIGHFADPKMAMIQTPQDYRDQFLRGRYGKALYLSYLYFFKVSMAHRNEYNGIIYAGTMGLVRRSVLQEVGGWSEWCITEDAELSLRILDAGYDSLYVDKTYGRGLMPLDYAGLKKQRFRWAFGGMQILKLHWKKLLNPWSKGKLTFGQRFSYINGGLQWLSDAMTLAFTAILLIGTMTLLIGNTVHSHPLVGGIMMIPPLFILFAVMRFLWALRIRTRSTWRESADALTILMGLTWVVTLACIRGLVSRKGVFLRTPKQGVQPRFLDSLKIVKAELSLGLICLAGAIGLLISTDIRVDSVLGFTFGLLVWQAVIYLGAVRSSFWSYLETNPPSIARFRYAFRNVGHQVTNVTSEARAAVLLLVLLAGLTGLFYLGQWNAPQIERIQVADPLGQFLPARSVMAPTEQERVGAVLIREAEAARRKDVEAALDLWSPDGTIFDAAQTGRVWQGTDQLRERYVREFNERTYLTLRHTNLDIALDGDRAVIRNDLNAVVRSRGRTEHLQLPKSDEWTLRRSGEGWTIVRLEKRRN